MPGCTIHVHVWEDYVHVELYVRVHEGGLCTGRVVYMVPLKGIIASLMLFCT